MLADRFIAWALALALAFCPALASAQSPQVRAAVLNYKPIVAAAPSGLPLDGITTGVKACYSTRQLLTAYVANKAIKVQETTGNTTQDIGFSANVINASALTTFCTGKTCKVITWYDQCGGGFDQTNSVSLIAGSPIIFQSGSINTINGKPALLFVAGTPTSLSNASLTANPVNTLFQNAVVSVNIATGFGGITGETSPTNGGLEWRVDQTTGLLHLLAAGVASIASSSAGISTLTGAVVENQYNSSTGAWAFWINGGAQGTGTQAQTMTAANSSIGASGVSGGLEPIDGSIGEIIMYDLVGGPPSGTRTSIEAGQRPFWGTP